MKSKYLGLGLAVAMLTAGSALASSHREAPFITKYPQSDGTDFYLFKSYEPGREDYVTMIANYIPVQSAYGGPNYFPLDSQALYEIHVDNDGDSVEDVTFQFRFQDSFPNDETIKLNVGGEEISTVLRNIGVLSADDQTGLNHLETYSINLVEGDRRRGAKSSVVNVQNGSNTFAKPFDYSGTKTFGGPGNYTNYAESFIHEISIPNCAAPGRVFVGQRNEAFKISLGEVFDLVNFVPIEGDSAPGVGDGGGFPGGVTQDPARNILARDNVTPDRRRRNRHWRMDDVQPTTNQHPEPSPYVREARDQRRPLGADVAHRFPARQRTCDRLRQEGPLQCQRA